MISEGVDIPRLRVGVFASNVVTRCISGSSAGALSATTSDRADREAYVYVPTIIPIRAARRRDHGRRAFGPEKRLETDDPGALLAAAQRSDRASDEGGYASINAIATESQTLNFGPLFNPTNSMTTPVRRASRTGGRRGNGRATDERRA